MAKLKAPTLQDFLNNINAEYACWHDIYKNGCNDPFWADGTNLNLVRNHIIFYIKQIKAVFGKDLCIDIPPEVDQNYMAKLEEIQTSAIKTLSLLENDPNYRKLLSYSPSPYSKQLKKVGYANAICRVSVLKEAIEKNDVVGMRRCSRSYNTSIQIFADCLSKVESIYPIATNVVFEESNGQLCLAF